MQTPAAISITTTTFPLSSDHLLTLVQFNVLRGSLANRQLLDNALSVDGRVDSTMTPTEMHVLPLLSPTALARVPPCLRPTPHQRTVLHPSWIDIFPHPTIRDNLILANGVFDADRLWLDVVGGLFEGIDDDSEASGVMLWETPWTWQGWELTEGFIERWGWMLQGCKEVLDETNRRRQERDEDRITMTL